MCFVGNNFKLAVSTVDWLICH